MKRNNMEQMIESEWETIEVDSAVEVYFEHMTDAGWERIGQPDEISPLRWTGLVRGFPAHPKRGSVYDESIVNVLPDEDVLKYLHLDNGHPLLLNRKPVWLEGAKRGSGEPYKVLVRTVVGLLVIPSQNT